MRKPTDRFFKILTEAIAKRNPYGVDIESERETQGFIPIIAQKPDYSYHGITKRENVFKGEVQKTLQEKGLAEKISDRLKIKSDIKKLEMKSEEPELFVGIKDLERAKLATLQKDLRELNTQIDEIKKDKNNKTYPVFLRKVLTDFFTVPGAKVARRYLFLPLKRNFTINDINILNKSVKLDKDLLSDLNKKKEVTASFSADVLIRQFLKKYGYSFKNEVKDFYNNVCYTKSNAMVKITDELRKIEKINLTEKQNALKKIKDPVKRDFIQTDIDKRKDYNEDFLKRMEAIELEMVDVENPNDMPVVVITWVPRMIMSQSTTTIWRSCMELSNERSYSGGINKHYVASSIENGVFIAWLVNIGDAKTIDNPIARILIKPYNDGEYFLWLPSRIYFDGSEGNNLKIFQQAVGKFCFNKQRKVIRMLERQKMFILMNVDSKKVYEDQSDSDKPVISMKRVFNNISKGYPYYNDFYQAMDFSTSKALAYLKSLKDDFLIKNQEMVVKILRYSLVNEDLSVFNYLVNRNEELTKNKETTKKAIQFFFGSIAHNRDGFVKHSFFSYIFKYYVSYLDTYDRYDFLNNEINKTQKTPITDTILNDEDFIVSCFNSKHTSANFSLLKNIISPSSEEQLKKLELVLSHLVKKNMIGILFNINNIEASSVLTINELLSPSVNFITWLEINYDSFNKNLQRLVDVFIKETEKTVNIEYAKEYMSRNKTNAIAYGENKRFLRTRNSFLKYAKIIKDNNVKVDYFSFLVNEAKYKRYDRDTYEFLLDNLVDKDKLKNEESLFIIAAFEQKQFEQRLEKFLVQFNANERKKMLQYLLMGVFRSNITRFLNKDRYFYEDYEKEKIKFFDEIENKITHVIEQYGEEIEKKNQEFVSDYISSVFKLKKNFISKISDFFIFDKEYVFEEYLDQEFRTGRYMHSEGQNEADVFVENIKILQDAFKIKKLKIEPSIGKSPVNISRYFFKASNIAFNPTPKQKIIIEAVRDVLDFSKIIDIIVNSQTEDKKYVSHMDFVFDLNDEKTIHDIFKHKSIYENERYIFKLFYRGTSHITHSFSSAAAFEAGSNSREIFMNVNKKTFDNIRFIFKNDYHFAMKTALKDINIKYYDKDYFFEGIILLNNIFNVDDEKFYASDYFKEIVIKNGLSDSMFKQKDFRKASRLFYSYVLTIPELNYDTKTKMEIDFINRAVSNDYKNKNTDSILKNIEKQFLDIDYDAIESKQKNELINNRLAMIFRNYDLYIFKDLDRVIDKAIELLDKIKYNKHVNNYENFFGLFKTFRENFNTLSRSENDKDKKHIERMYPIYLKYANAIILKYAKFALRGYDVKDIKQEKTEKPNDISLLIIFDEKHKDETKEAEELLRRNLKNYAYQLNIDIKTLVEK